jgi:anti-sigma factor RsiW
LRQKVRKMNCEEAEVLLHGLVDNEIEAEDACRIEAHVAACPCCAEQFRLHRDMREMLSNAGLRFAAPPGAALTYQGDVARGSGGISTSE